MPSDGHQIEIHPRALKDFGALDRIATRRVRSRIDELGNDPYPSGARKLQIALPHAAYRIRVGDYRVVYAVNEQTATVHVLGVGHRRDIYRRFR